MPSFITAHILSIMSFALSPRPSRPDQRARCACGTLTQISPVASTPAISVAPIPNMKQPHAPAVGECESPPTAKIPGRRWPRSGSSTWQMPCMSWNAAMPASRAKSRVSFRIAADSASTAGT